MPENLNNDELIALAREVLAIESRAVDSLRARLDDEFAAACKLIIDTPGRVVVTGMGKSGHISSKIAATLASTGTPAFFMHPAEASHGDLGMITAQDLVLAVSYSGETEEIVTILNKNLEELSDPVSRRKRKADARPRGAGLELSRGASWT